jgi:hypothetical protein
MVLMLGASIYQSMTEISREEQDERTVLSYIWTKFKNNDENGKIYVGEFNRLPALVYDENFGGYIYRTVIYHYNGWVYELFFEDGLEFYPEDGTQIMELDSIRFEELEAGIISISAGSKRLLLSQRTVPGQDSSDDLFDGEVIIG